MTNVWSAMEDPQHPRPQRRRVEFSAPGDPSQVYPHGIDPQGVDPHSLDPHWAELSALVTRAEANRVEMAALQAERAEVCAAALDLVALRVAQREAERPGRELGDTIPLREVIAELSAALRVGERTMSNWLGDGAALVGTYPATLQALREGRIDERHASAIIDEGLPLSADNRAEYERAILPVAETETAPGTRQIVRIIAARLQPDIVAENQRRALAERRVRAFDLDDGLARLLLDAPAALVHGIYERLTTMGDAQAAVDAADASAAAPVDADDLLGEEAAGGQDIRTLDQRRADIMCDMLLTGSPTASGDNGLGAIRATVQVTVPILTLAGLGDEPALLDGEAPIDPETARTLAAHAASWQRVMIHPVTHEPLRIDDYRPGKRLRRLLEARDQHCRWPGCRRRARRCDIDHTIPFQAGGKTRSDNLEALCPHHHTLKHASLWRVTQLGGGTLEFVSPTRRRYRNNAPPVVVGTAGRRRWAAYLYTPLDPADRPAF